MSRNLKLSIPLICAVHAMLGVSAQAADHNYAEALQKSIYFYEAQRSGPLPSEENNHLANDLHNGFLPNRVEWRGDSYLDDGKYNQFGELISLDLTGGWHDAGDHVKFGLPMAFSASVMGWGILEFWDAYEASGQLPYALDNIRWVSDYFLKAHVAEYEFYAQVGDGIIDHSLWAAPETQALELKRIHGAEKYRPALKLTLDNPGADLVGQTAAALTIASLIFEKNSVNEPNDAIYAKELLKHAEQLFDFAYQTKDFNHGGDDPSPGTYTNSMVDDQGTNYAMNYYNSSSGAKDEIPWAAGWLYLATQKAEYLHKAEENYTDIAENTGHFAWYPAWDDIRNAVYYLMEKVAATPNYTSDTIIADSERHDGYYDYELHSNNYLNEMLHNKNYTPGGMIYLDGFASARATAMVSMVALVHRNYLVEHAKTPEFQSELAEFANTQMSYVLGDNPHNLSYMVGYGDQWQLAAHHRSSHGSSRNDIGDPEVPLHILYGAISGGPGDDDSFSTDRADFPMTEVATDMNAGLTGALAGLVGIHGGTPLANFPEPEDRSSPGAFVSAKIGYPNGDDRQSGALLNIKMINETSYPPREVSDVTFRYFMDLSDEISTGYNLDNLTLSAYYDSSNKNQISLQKWGTESGIYYVEGTSGTISPVGDSEKSAIMEIYIGDYVLGGWDYSNDPSYAGLNGETFELAENIALYDASGELVWGSEPNGIPVSSSSSSSSLISSSASNSSFSSSLISSSSSSSSSLMSSSSSSISSTSSSNSSSPATGGSCQCNWYGADYPMCNGQDSGWGWENSDSCIGIETCNSQYGSGGPVNCGTATSTSSSSSSTSSASTSSTESSSSSTSSISSCTEMCQWYQDDPRPICQNQESGWGWENNQSCVARSTCESQSGNGGLTCQ